MNYRIRWDLLSPIETQLQSDTIFGHICWAINYIWDESKLKSFLEEMRKAPVMVLSSAFPSGSLPVPKLPHSPQDHDEFSRELSERDRMKEAKKAIYLPVEIWQQSCNDYHQTEVLLKAKGIKELLESALEMHNTINRNTGTTGKGGANLFSEEVFTVREENGSFDSYLETDYFSVDDLGKIFEYIEHSGFGRNKSTGKGRFRLALSQEELPSVQSPNAWLVLSNMVPAIEDSVMAYYDCFTKFGKLGGSFAAHKKSPYKKPLSMLKPGAVFLGEKAPQGCFVTGIHPDEPEICQYAYAYSIGFRLREQPGK